MLYFIRNLCLFIMVAILAIGFLGFGFMAFGHIIMSFTVALTLSITFVVLGLISILVTIIIVPPSEAGMP